MPVDYRDDVERQGEPRKARKEGSPLEALSEDMGPLPVWGWIAVAVGAVLIYRRMFASKTTAATSPTLPAYPVAPDAGTIINDYRTGAAPSSSPVSSSPAGAIAPTLSTGSGWGPSWPDKATGVVPDRPCPPGQFVVTNFGENWWSCETYQQISGLMAALPLLPKPTNLPTTAPAGSTTANCPAGYQLVNSGTGLTCVPVAGAQPAGGTTVTAQAAKA